MISTTSRAFVFFIVLMSHKVVCRNCDSSDELGHSDVYSVSGLYGVSDDTQFIMTDSEYVSPCCGVVTSWKIYTLVNGTIAFQVWRPNSGGTEAQLIGENVVDVTNFNEFSYNVPASDQISLQPNDVIGWYSRGPEIVEFAFGFSENFNNFIEDISQPSIGETVILATQVPYRTFAIHAQLSGYATPSLTNLDDVIYKSTTSITDTVTPLYTVTSSSASATFTLESITPSSHFTIYPSTGEVLATTTSVSVATYVLNISVSENCSDSSMGILTIVLTDTTPVWSNLDAAVSVSKNSVSTSSPSYTVLATTSDTNQSVSYSLLSITPQSDFTLDGVTGDVTSITPYLNESTYTLVIRASDAYGNDADATLILNVVNSVPDIISLPNVAYVSEASVDETLLHTVNVTDLDDDVITCSMTSSPAGPFTTKYTTTNNILTTGVYLYGNPSLNYTTTDTYTLTITCFDGTDSDIGILHVYITPNNVPQITNLQNTTSIQSSTTSSSVIFHVTATDVENDAMFFDLACLVASPCPFSIYSDGSIVLTTSILSTTINAYELDISVKDAFSSSGVHRLTVFVTDLNTAPEMTNLPTTIQITEDTAIGTTIFDISVYDEDGDSSHSFTAYFSPAISSSLFQINSTTGEIVLATSLNYLVQENNYTISVQVSDDQGTSTSETLAIEVVDVNQAPVLYQTNYRVEVNEGSAGTEVTDPGFNVFDADSDILTYSWGGGNDTGKFSINTTTGIVSFSVDIDADDASVDTLYVWLVVISDPEGLSTTATLTLSVLDDNDNVPLLTSSYYAAVVSSSARLGTSFMAVQSTDGDVMEENRQLDYSISSTSLFSIDHNGSIFVYADLTSFTDTIETFSIRVRNPGSNSSDRADVSVLIEPDEEDGDFFDDGENVAWVTLVCIFGSLVLAGIAYLCLLGYQKWSSSSLMVTKGNVTQVAPYDTKMADTTPRDRSTVVTPRDVKIFHDFNTPWEGWSTRDWQA